MSARNQLRSIIVLLLVTVMVAGPVAQAAAISRDLVMQRAQTWVDREIPYSQSGYADLAGNVVSSSADGWRRDCSGFVSMCWSLSRPGATTRTLQQYSVLINKAALQPGDALISYNNHVVLFGGWADDQRTSYYALEMSSSSSAKSTPPDGTVMRITPYPYWNNDQTYKPYRLMGIDQDLDLSTLIKQVYGPSRFDTAIAASKTAFANGSAPAVIIASGENWPDALGASALAGAVGGPVLLTKSTALPSGLIAEIRRLGAKEAIITGAEGAVSADVAKALSAVEGLTITRVGGTDRYETSRLIAAETAKRVRSAGRALDPTVFVTTGANFPDALAASPIAYAKARPILLTRPDALSPQVKGALSTFGAKDVIVLGSTGAVSAAVETSLSSTVRGEVSRLAGADRYATARTIATYGRTNGLSYSCAAIATGGNFPDALAGGAMAGRMGTVLLLTPSTMLDSELAEMMLAEPRAFGTPHTLGSDGALKPIVLEAIALALQAR